MLESSLGSGVLILASQGDLPLWAFGLIVLVLGVGVGVAAYYGVQSIKQATLLKNVVPVSALGRHEGQSVAVSGKPELDGMSGRGRDEYIWLKITFQEYRRSYSSSSRGSRGGWHTVSTDVKTNDFFLHDHGKQVRVRNQATEVHGTESVTSGSGGGGGFLGGLFSGGGQTRSIREYLPLKPRITVCGLVVQDRDGWTIVKDGEVGMLITGGSAGSQATWESVKGWGGVVVLPLAWLIGAIAAYTHLY